MAVVFFTLILCSFFRTEDAAATDVLTLNTADKPPYSTETNTGIYDRIILRVFDDLGLRIKINHLLSARSIENVDAGIDDAEYARIKGLSEKYNNIRIVDEKLIDFAFTAFAKKKIPIDGWESLKPFHVAYIRGWKIYEINVFQAKSIILASTEKELFSLLEQDRVDLVLYERLRGYDFLKRNGINGIMALDPPLSVRGMYLYVNKKHEARIPDIETALRAFKAGKDYAEMIRSFSR
jgi:polar amino acid transport system substrate-binding protein